MAVEPNTSMPDYRRLDALSGSTAWRCITQSPAHAALARGRDDVSSVADKGSVAHKILLEGNEDGVVIVAADDWRTKAAQNQRKDAYAENLIPVLDKDMASIRAMVTAVQRYVQSSDELADKDIFTHGTPEVTVTWTEANGVACKARPDLLTDRYHISFKTTLASANPVQFSKRTMADSGYDFSLMFYDRGLHRNGIYVEHRILVVEQNPPYGVSLIALDATKQAICACNVDIAIKMWGECLAKGYFPAYKTATHYAEATPWELAATEARELEYLTATGAVV